MPRNTLKDLRERYGAKQKEVRGLKAAFDNAAEGEARTKPERRPVKPSKLAWTHSTD